MNTLTIHLTVIPRSHGRTVLTRTTENSFWTSKMTSFASPETLKVSYLFPLVHVSWYITYAMPYYAMSSLHEAVSLVLVADVSDYTGRHRDGLVVVWSSHSRSSFFMSLFRMEQQDLSSNALVGIQSPRSLTLGPSVIRWDLNMNTG